MFTPRTPLPPQSNPADLLRQSNTNRIANTLQRPGINPGLIGPPVQQPPAYGTTDPVQPGFSVQPQPGARPPSFSGSPQPWMTYEMLMRSAKPGIEHIAQQAAQGQRPIGTYDAPPRYGTQPQFGHPGQSADWYRQLMASFGGNHA